MRCPSCNGRNPDHSQYCLHCGGRFVLPTDDDAEDEVRPYKLGATTIGGVLLGLALVLGAILWTDIWYTRSTECTVQPSSVGSNYGIEICLEHYTPRFSFVPRKRPTRQNPR